MKKLIFLISSTLIFSINYPLIYCQQPVYIRGKVIDSKTSDTVPFATVYLKNSQIGIYINRELFVQEYNGSIPFNDSYYMEYKPLDQNRLSRYSGKDKYWMNTPENIKIEK